MNVLLILIPVSLFLGGLSLVALIWMLRTQQYDDPDGDAWRILEDDPSPANQLGEDYSRGQQGK